MKAVFLDFGTMGSGLDLGELESLVDELVVHDESPRDTVAQRISDAEIVFTNKIRLTRELLELAPKLKFIALTATGLCAVFGQLPLFGASLPREVEVRMGRAHV